MRSKLAMVKQDELETLIRISVIITPGRKSALDFSQQSSELIVPTRMNLCCIRKPVVIEAVIQG